MSLLIQNYIENIIKKKITENGIVLWYDPDKNYKDIVDKIDLCDVPSIKYEGSYYDLRFKSEKHFENQDRQSLLIYVDRKRDDVNFPLIELEKSGCVIEPSGSLEENTSLAVIAKSALSGRLSSEAISEICKKIEERTISIEEIEKIAENAKSIDTATLSIIFKGSEPQTIVLSFITNTTLDETIRTKRVEKELNKLIYNFLGIDLKDTKKN
ncbi:MAG: hypothetical protein SCARUB_03675 [Candidatus Scalindua rubra]|uniref:Uncharacterized protein n=1 Tax=Candidatus Scalindua rubra TaxID=1872076 RepID=A0A1E3X8B8_9BACT|nr:MAG: hypothetical protein SCARUB_03675 [Candidatus Scalindua rubra]